jgi:uncharacterized membrane protein (UPF0127 family)
MFNLRNVLLIVAVVLMSVLLKYSFKLYSHSESGSSLLGQSSPQKQSPQVIIKNIKIAVDVAKTYEEKDKGLGGRENLGKNEGMLFVFDYNNVPIFWMKGMLIPLDIIWISDDKVVDLHKNIKASEPGTPESNLPKYSPKKSVDYVLEVNAGFSDKNDIQIGDSVKLLNI